MFDAVAHSALAEQSIIIRWQLIAIVLKYMGTHNLLVLLIWPAYFGFCTVPIRFDSAVNARSIHYAQKLTQSWLIVAINYRFWQRFMVLFHSHNQHPAAKLKIIMNLNSIFLLFCIDSAIRSYFLGFFPYKIFSSNLEERFVTNRFIRFFLSREFCQTFVEYAVATLCQWEGVC